MFKEKNAAVMTVAATATLCLAVWTIVVLLSGLGWWNWHANRTLQWTAIREIVTVCGLIWAYGLCLWILGFIAFHLFIRQKADGQQRQTQTFISQQTKPAQPFASLKHFLRRRYGRLWRNKVRLLWVAGEAAQIAAIAPGLAQQQWLEGRGTVLIHGGSLSATVDIERLSALRRLRGRRPLDGIVLALDNAQATAATLDGDLRTLELVAQVLRYQPPVYLWQLHDSDWPQDTRITQTLGALFPPRAVPQDVERQLRAILPAMLAQGTQQLCADSSHDYLLRVAKWLKEGGISGWKTLLTLWLTGHLQQIPLRGLLFSPSLKAEEAVDNGLYPHRWPAPAVWQGIIADCGRARGVPVGGAWRRSLGVGLLALIALWAAGSLLSFIVNRQQIVSATQRVQLLRQPVVNDQQLIDLQVLRNDIGRLQNQLANGAPWYQRFGLNHNAPLSTALLPWYGRANQRLIRDAAAQALTRQLTVLVNLPPRSPQRAQLAKAGYDQLKAYLMMARPDKADAAFYRQAMTAAQQTRQGVAPALWQSIAPDLWGFYMDNLPSQPTWRITPDAALVTQARQVLLAQIGRRNAESTLYENMLLQVRRNYADMTLEDMTPQTNASRLFTTEEVVPGMFTRQAWEGGVREAIDKAVATRREAIDKAVATRRDEIDWVLSDSRQTVSGDVSPEALKQRLTDRYFTDFAGAWLGFLNSIRLNPARNIADVTDQLTLAGDVRQSPLIALMNTLAWQGQTGQQREGVADSLVKSAKNLLDKDKQPFIDQQAGGARGPLESTFGPLLALMGKNPSQSVVAADSTLSLQTWLTRLTRVRLRLQQVANAPDPQAMMQQLAQTVFQGKSVDLTDTQEYGSLVAASLGEEWSGFGQTMFVQPLTQAWETVLQPSAASLNEAWQRSVVANWHSAFDGRYPFAAGKNDVSLPMLAAFIRRDSGRIDQFLARELGGVLNREGSRWVADSAHSQGLTFNPAFLKAINQLSSLSDILFTDGSQGMGFELQGVATPGIVETQLTLDGQNLHYFNQLAEWKSFRWPGTINKPGAMLSWSSVAAGARLLANDSGPWGTLRMLERMKRQQIGDGLFRLTVNTPDNRQLQWLLRTELGDGPLALLKLRNFTLPTQIFIVEASRAEPFADGDVEE
ncbi:ImcF-related family protein [Klebsiella aerogenes]|uniref:ImcF-related family protein n=7 Tax=Enterobacteriaceae TaxID=543 RepID=UPI0029D72793|nr:ImcF-related family protein [Klebsiella aerogenes]MDX7511732.1 ImcF-related family protein [Klebsiella aerogenes]